MATELGKKTMLRAFKQKKSPSMFLTGFFQSPEQNKFKSRKVVIDVKRNEEMIAVDVIRGSGGRLNINKRFTTKEYIPPMYDEYTSLFEEELNERMPGRTEYDTDEYIAQAIAIITDDQVENQEIILRAIEKQASDMFFTGTVVLLNNDTIDFKQKATHQINAATVWSDSDNALPLDDLAGAAEVNRKDGKVDSDIIVMGEQALQEFFATAQVKDSANFRRINIMDIMPPSINVDGAAFHGQLTVGAYNMQLWTYPQFYYVPMGYSLPNEGTLVPFVPTDKVLVTSSMIRMDLVYAGIPEVVNRVSPELAAMGITGIPVNIPADFHPYGFTDDERTNIKAGVRSAPLCIPTQIDGYSVITT